MSGPTTVSTPPVPTEGTKSVMPTRSGVKAEKNPSGVSTFVSLLAAIEPDVGLTAQVAVQPEASVPSSISDKDDLSSVLKDCAAGDLTFFLTQGNQRPVETNENPVKVAELDGTPATAVIGQVFDRTRQPVADTDNALLSMAHSAADTGKVKKHSGPGRDLLQSALGSLAASAPSSQLRSGSSSEASQETMALKVGALNASKILSPREEGVVASAISVLADSKPLDRPQARDAFKPGGPGVEGIWGQGNPSVGNGAMTYAASAETATVTAEAVAEQVTYWVNQEVQNAELTLDGVGQEPIEVSISLQGNEANVAFRSDQAATREILEGAVSHLKDMLAHHGLALSGVSVGSSGPGAQHSSKDRHLADSRQATVRITSQESTSSTTLTRTRGDRVLDLFV